MNRHLILLLALALPLPAAAQDSSKPKMAVLPFASLTGGVPPKAGAKAAGMLANELRNTEKVELVEVKRPPLVDAHQPGLDAARKQVAEAQRLRAKRKFRLADESLQRALAELKKAAAGITDVAELADTYALLSAVQYNTGRDEEGQQSLWTALALAPSRELPLAQTSPLFSKVVEDTRKKLKATPPGTLVIESLPSGAPVMVDSVALGSTPLLVKEVPPGLHLWRVMLPSGEVGGGVVEVASGKQAKVSAKATTQDPEFKVQAQLSQNKLDQEVVKALKEFAQAAQADLLFFGALSSEGKGLGLDGFLFSAPKGEVRRVPRSQFDTELLSAGMEFYGLAGKLVASEGAAFGELVKVPATVTGASGRATKVAEVAYGYQPGAEIPLELDPAAATPAEDKGRTPLTPTKRAPLKRKP